MFCLWGNKLNLCLLCFLKIKNVFTSPKCGTCFVKLQPSQKCLCLSKLGWGKVRLKSGFLREQELQSPQKQSQTPFRSCWQRDLGPFSEWSTALKFFGGKMQITVRYRVHQNSFSTRTEQFMFLHKAWFDSQVWIPAVLTMVSVVQRGNTKAEIFFCST